MPLQAGTAAAGSRSIENTPSQLLTAEENQRVFRQLGERCQTLATAVVQLYRTSPPTHTLWIRHGTGVCCFVRDNSRRAYFLQLYGADGKLWEQELYHNFRYHRVRKFFHTFEADACQAGLNFADDGEAERFGSRMEEHLRNKQMRREQRTRSRHMSENRQPNGGASRSATLPHSSGDNNQLRPTTNIAKYNDRRIGKREKRSKLCKADISLPTNFQHISHVGWDPDKGFDLENVDPNLKQFFNRAGVSDTQLQDQDTRKFIYDFIDKHGGVEAAIKEVHQLGGIVGPPPPVPARQPAPGRPAAPPAPPVRTTPTITHHGAAPPPPPSRTRQAPPTPPSSLHKPGSAAPPPPPPPPPAGVPHPPPPPPPPPPTGGSAGPPPPPPPPSASSKPSSNLPAVSGDRSMLMDSIRAGIQLRSVSAAEPGERNSGGDQRSDLMQQIRHGATLKPVTESVAPPPTSEQAPPGLAGALARALADRKRVIHSSDEDDEEDDEEEDDDEWED